MNAGEPHYDTENLYKKNPVSFSTLSPFTRSGTRDSIIQRFLLKKVVMLSFFLHEDMFYRQDKESESLLCLNRLLLCYNTRSSIKPVQNHYILSWILQYGFMEKK